MNDHHYGAGRHVHSENWESINVSILSQQPIDKEDSGNFSQIKPFLMHWQTQYIFYDFTEITSLQ